MEAWLERFERVIAAVLLVLMGTVVFLATVELAWLIIEDMISPPMMLIEIDELLDLFGFFMLVLIGLELMETIRAYLIEHVVHAEVVVEVAIIAIARKVIILEVKEYEALSLIGIAAIVVALAVTYFIIRRFMGGGRAARVRESQQSEESRRGDSLPSA